MQLTTDYLKRAFIQYNKEIFHEELPLPILKISNAKHRLGSMHYKWKIAVSYTHLTLPTILLV